MCPPAASHPDVISTNCTDGEKFMSLIRMMSGAPLPGNVCTDVNPYECLPTPNLTGDIWFLIPSEWSKVNKHGYWKIKGDASKIFSDTDITGWITTREFYEGQAPHWQKTDWVMHEYSMTFKGACKDNKAELSSLCRLLSGDEQNSNHAKNMKISSSTLASKNCMQPSHVSNSAGQGSTSKSHVDKDDEIRKLTETQIVVNAPPQNLTDVFAKGDLMELLDLEKPLSPSISKDKDDETRNMTASPSLTHDEYFARDDGLELLDLDTPISPSSRSGTMSSNESFDALELLQDLDSESKEDQSAEGSGPKYSISASLKPDEVVVISPVTSGPLIISNGGSNSPTEQVQRSKECGKHSAEKDVAKCGEGASSSSFPEKAAPGRKKRLSKYFCFMPF